MRHTRIQPPPERRLSVRELARKLGLTTDEVQAHLASINEHAPTVWSRLESPVVRRVRALAGVVETPTTPAAPPERLPPPRPRGLAPPAPRPRRENNPLRDLPSVQRRDERESSPNSPGPATGRSGLRSARPRFDTPDEAAPAWEHLEWQLYGFTEVDRDTWVAEGLRVSQATVARDLRDAGLVPADLQVQLSGWSVAARVAQGEGAKHVARLLQRQRAAEESG